MILRWSAVQDLPDGSPYNNHGVHIIRMRWGKVFDIDANEDSQLVAASLQIWAAYGVKRSSCRSNSELVVKLSRIAAVRPPNAHRRSDRRMARNPSGSVFAEMT